VFHYFRLFVWKQKLKAIVRFNFYTLNKNKILVKF